MSKGLYRCHHFEVRRFGWKLEIACFNKRGGFKWAFYLPNIHFFSGKKLRKEAHRILGEVDD